MSSHPHRSQGGGGGRRLHGSIIKSRMSQQNKRAGPGRPNPFKDVYERDQGHGDDEIAAHSSMQFAPGAKKAPPHLKGREIGMWYARQKNPNQQYKANPMNSELFLNADNNAKMRIFLTPHRRANILKLLGQLETLNSAVTDQPNHLSTKFQASYLKNVRDNRLASCKEDGGAHDPDGSQEPSGLLFDVGSFQDLGENRMGPVPVEKFRKHSLDETLWEEMQLRKDANRNPSMTEFCESLPTFKVQDDVLDLILQNQVVVVEGETGSGKTTQIPQYILDRWTSDLNGSVCNIVCTQPRRIAAISVAERVAQERSETVGGKSIGYSIRLEKKLPKGRSGGTIVFCTTGVLLQHLKSDPYLNRVSHLIVDEVHERDVLNDFLLAIVKDLTVSRPDLKVILMSATINAQQFAAYFNNCPVFRVPGFTHPVQEYYLEDAIEKTGFEYERKKVKHGTESYSSSYKRVFEMFISPYIRQLKTSRQYSRKTIEQISYPESEEDNVELIMALIDYLCKSDSNATEKSILVFLPGYAEISKLHRLMTESSHFPESCYRILPVHSQMPTTNQKEVFNRPPPGTRKIVLATNIAETSITIDDIVYVIDCGKMKMTNFDVDKNIETLGPEWVSIANARQRRGRAGRTQPGVCYHLFSHAREELLVDFTEPEVLRKGVQEEILRIKILKLGEAAPFFNRLMDPPRSGSVQLALKRLRQLHALDEHENLTPLGFHLAQLPMGPQIGKMILMAAIFSCCDPILSIAASLSFRDPFYIPLGEEKIVDAIRKEFSGVQRSDHIALIKAMEGYEDAQKSNAHRTYCQQNRLSSGTLYQLQNMKAQFAEHLKESGFLKTVNYKDRAVNVNSESMALIKGIICSGLYPNVAKVKIKHRGKGRIVVTTYTEDDGQVRIHPKSVNFGETSFRSPFLIYHLKRKSTAIFLHDTTMVGPFPLIFFGGQLDFIEAHGYGSVGVDGNIRFLCDRTTYNIIERLRKELDNLLQYKIQHPGPTEWNGTSREAILLQAINELITTDDDLDDDAHDCYEKYDPGKPNTKTVKNARDADWESDDEDYVLPNPDL